MKSKAILFAFVLLSGIAVAAPPPDEIRYTFVELAAGTGEVEIFGVDIDATAAGIGGSVAVHENIALFGAVAVGTVDTSDVGAPPDVDTTSVSLGVNIHMPINPTVDVVIPVAFE